MIAEKMRDQVTYRGLLSVAASIIAIMVGLGTIHSIVVVPWLVSAATRESRAIIIEELSRHEKAVHAGSVTRHEFDLLLSEINEIKELIRNR